MDAILHIGTEKTGTTSFQRFCHLNRAELAAQGVLYPARLGGDNHRSVAMYGLSAATPDEAIVARGIRTEHEMDAFRRSVENTLDEQLKAAPADAVCLLSSEHLHSRLKTPDQIEHVHALLAPRFDRITVMVHLRPQVDVAVSLASTQSRVGGAVRRGFFDQMSPEGLYYNYDKLVAAWEDVFGVDAVRCIAFKSRPDFLGLICEELGIDRTSLAVPTRENEALDVRTMAMVNALVDSGSPQRIDFRVLDRLPVLERLRLSRDLARKLQAPFESHNRALIARRGDLSPGDLQPDWSRFPEEGNLHLLEDKVFFAESFAALVAHYNDQIDAGSNLGGNRNA